MPHLLLEQIWSLMEDHLLDKCFMNRRLFDSHFHPINHKIHKSKFREYNFLNLINDYNLSEINVTLTGGIFVLVRD